MKLGTVVTLLGLCIIYFVYILPMSCTQPDKATRVLNLDGFTDVQITGYKYFSCGKGDSYHTGFIAKKNGMWVEGTVCAGWLFKGNTIRFE